MADNTLLVKVAGDVTDLQKKMADAESTIAKFKDKCSSVSAGMKKIGGDLQNIGGSLTSKITKPALAAGAALGGITLAKGWNRMTAIDDARAKLNALTGDSGRVKEAMNNALASVKGTAFGMDEAATTAASAMASGVKEGAELESYLKTVADTAAIAGTDMASMGSVFNKVAAKGKVDSEILNQLSDQGVPALQMLAKQLGVTSGEVSEMVTNGEVDFQTFQAAMKAGVDGAAVEIGSTTITGAISNIGASISRIGENFIGSTDDADSFAGKLLPILNTVKDNLGGLEEKAKEWGSIFADAFSYVYGVFSGNEIDTSGFSSKSQGIVSAISPIVEKVKGLIDWFSQLSTKSKVALSVGAISAGPVISTFGKITSAGGTLLDKFGSIKTGVGMLSEKIGALGGVSGSLKSVFSSIASPVGIAVIAITALVAAFAYLMTTNEDFRNSIMESVGTIASSLGPVLSSVGNMIKDLIAAVLPIIQQTLTTLAPVIAQIVSIIAQVVAQVAPLIAQLVDALAPIIVEITKALGKVLSAVMPVLSAALQVALSILEKTIPVIGTILKVAVDVITSIWRSVSLVFGKIGDFIGGIFSKVQENWKGLQDFCSDVFSGVSDAFKKLVDKVKGFVNKVTGGINSAIDVINGIPGVHISKIPQLAHGTDNWNGGFAYMNEGGRGELTYLPNGSQVIPHDISVQYAKESARANAAMEPIDMSNVMDGMTIQIVNNTSVDGTPLKETCADYTVKKISGGQSGLVAARGW